MSIVHYLDGLGLLYGCESSVIVLVTNQSSLISILRDPSTDAITRALKQLHARAEEQNVFNVDFWGASIKKVSKRSVIAANEKSIQEGGYTSLVHAGQMLVNAELRRLRGAMVFDIRC